MAGLKSSTDGVLVEASVTLTRLHNQASRQRKRISAVLMLFGGLLFPAGLAIGFLRAAGLVPSSAGPDGFHFAYSLPGLYAILLAVLPADTRLVRYVPVVLLFYSASGVAMIVGVLVLARVDLPFNADHVGLSQDFVFFHRKFFDPAVKPPLR
jgi:hypothetical protein